MNKIGLIQIFSKRYGGVVYLQQAFKALSNEFNMELVDLEAKYFKKRRYLKFLESFYYLFRLKGEQSLWIRDFYSVLSLSKKKTKGKNLAVIFHIDFLKFPFFSRIPLFLLEKLFFYNKLRNVDAILTISEYWKSYFLKKGYKNVYKIYCGFNLKDFNITEDEVSEFKKKYNLNGKPIIYLGNCQKVKGVVGAYDALKDLDVHLVTSSRKQANVPTLNFNLDYKEYLMLLKASSVVVTMSQFKEGWCMTAHEAMLCKTPVIGSGLGGMKELLDSGKQMVCPNFSELREKVVSLLNDEVKREKIGEDGYTFAKQFTIERFEKEWSEVVNKILKQNG